MVLSNREVGSEALFLAIVLLAISALNGYCKDDK